MPAAVIPIGTRETRELARARKAGSSSAGGTARGGNWWLLEVVVGTERVPFGILLVDRETNELTLRCRSTGEVARALEADQLEEQQLDILDWLEEDLRAKAAEQGAGQLIESLEESLSNFLRIGDRTSIAWTGSAQKAVDRLFDEFVDPEIRRYETHLPWYGLRAAATKFGDSMSVDSTSDGGGDDGVDWIRVNAGKAKLSAGMFVAHVVGRSMEPLIPDDSLCIFRTGVTGSRSGRYLLIEKFGESDFANRYTVKRYTSRKRFSAKDADDSAWEHDKIRLEPLNPEFEAFELGPDEFRVIAEFVEVLGPASE